MSQQSPFLLCRHELRECWKPHLFLLHLHCVPRCLLDCCLFSAVFMSICPSVCVSHSFSGVLERNASSKSWANSEPDVNNWGGQEAREWLLQYSYVILTWLPATRPCTQYLWSLTDDWGCNAVSSPIPCLPTIPLFFPLYIFSSPVHMPPPFSPPSPSLCCLSSCPLLFFSRHFFSSPSHLLPSLWRLWHAHGPNSIIGQIKEMLLNSLNRKKEHTHAPDMPRLQSYTYTKLTQHI